MRVVQRTRDHMVRPIDALFQKLWRLTHIAQLFHNHEVDAVWL